MNKWSIAIGVVVAAVLAGGVTGGVILGQSGGDRPERYVDPLLTPIPVNTNPDCIADPDAFGCPPHPLTPQPSPILIRTDIAPIPFETGLRTDCPQGWESIGQPGVFSICYPPDEWDAHPAVAGEADDWQGSLFFNSRKDVLLGIAVRFFPRGIPPDTDMCVSPYTSREGDAQPVRVGNHEGLVCVITELGKVREYRILKETDIGLVRATVNVAEPPEGTAGALLPTAMEVLASLRIEQ